MVEPLRHLTLKILHETVSLLGCLLLEVFEAIAGHVSALCKHIIKISKFLLPLRLFSLDVRMHLVAFPFDLVDNVLLVGDPRLLLFDQAISDALNLRADRIECIVMVLDSIALFRLNSSLELIPTRNSFSYAACTTTLISTYMRLWLIRHVSRKISPSSLV